MDPGSTWTPELMICLVLGFVNINENRVRIAHAYLFSYGSSLAILKTEAGNDTAGNGNMKV